MCCLMGAHWRGARGEASKAGLWWSAPAVVRVSVARQPFGCVRVQADQYVLKFATVCRSTEEWIECVTEVSRAGAYTAVLSFCASEVCRGKSTWMPRSLVGRAGLLRGGWRATLSLTAHGSQEFVVRGVVVASTP